MRWPWVSRAALDAVERHRDELLRQVAWFGAQIQSERAERLVIMRGFDRMRKEGYVSLPAPPAPKQPSRVEQAILDRTNGNAPLRRHLLNQAAQLAADGLEDDEIIASVTTFRSDRDEDE